MNFATSFFIRRLILRILVGTPFQVQDVLFVPDGSSFFSSSDLVSRDSADRNLMAWDFRTGVKLSNQIYQVKSKSTIKEAPFWGLG